MAEQRVFLQNPDAIVVRLGWQIGDAPGSNNMIDYLEKHGTVKASRCWLPACSFVEDTAAVLAQFVGKKPGLYMIDGNTKWNFCEIASALNTTHGNRWTIIPTDDFVYDQRMIDLRLSIPSLQTSLTALR